MTAAPDDLLALAVRVAIEAGELVRAGRARAVEGELATKSSPTDIVTEMDMAAERHIVAGLLAIRPHDGVLGEEGALRTGSSGVRWVIDPIDGTVNYLYGIPQYAVSVAAECDGEVVAGVVHDPGKRETWTATIGGGGRCNGRLLQCSQVSNPAGALVATGFSYEADLRAVQARILAAVLPRLRDVRRLGSAALDLCAVAAGRVDAYYESGTNPWDVAAGALVAREAGARTGTLPDGTVVAAPPPLFDPLVALLTEAAG